MKTFDIIATIGGGAEESERIQSIINSGTSILRYNLGRSNDFLAFGKRLQVVNRLLDRKGNKTKIMIDIPIPGYKIRFGRFNTRYYHVTKGLQKTLKCAPLCYEETSDFLPVNSSDIGSHVSTGEIVTIGDGQVACKVVDVVSKEMIIVEFINDGAIKKLSSINCGHSLQDFDSTLMEQYALFLQKWRPHYIAFSFVESIKDRDMYAKKLGLSMWNPQIVSKIETRAGVDNAVEILHNSDLTIIARGDLGLNLPLEQLGLVQKDLTLLAQRCNRPIIVSTQILDSMVNNSIPARSDILDLTNIVLDGADGIMLCNETSTHPNPDKIISFARNVIKQVQVYQAERLP